VYGKTFDLFRSRLYIYICRIGRISSSIISRLCTIYNWNCYALKVKHIIGIVMLSKSSTYIRRNLSRLKTVFPRQYAKLHEIKEKLSHKK